IFADGRILFCLGSETQASLEMTNASRRKGGSNQPGTQRSRGAHYGLISATLDFFTEYHHPALRLCRSSGRESAGADKGRPERSAGLAGTVPRLADQALSRR